MRVRFDAGGRRWVLRWEGGGLDVELGADGLAARYPGAARPAGVPAGPMVEAEGRPVAWALAGWRRDGAALEVTLAAAGLPLEAVARLAVAAGVVAWRTTLRHRGGAAVAVTAARSALVAMPGPVARIHTLTGAWALETQPHVLPAAQAPLVLGSRSGRTGFAFQPWVALEGAQEWLLCELLWSGNWRLELRPDDDGMAVLAGLEPAGFCHVLADGAVLALPELLLARADGLGAATRRLHDARRRLRPDPDRAVPVQFNTWFPFPGEPEATRLLEVVPLAARLGCEAFVLDAGWSTTCEDTDPADWWAAVGDWHVNPCAFPHGLGPLAASCRAHGMAFGLWFEPEAVGPAAPVRRSHPEWLHHPGGRAPAAEARAVLHLGIPEARAYALDTMARILRATRAGWLKWDFNMALFGPGWAPGLPPDMVRQDPLVAHVRGLYALQDAIRAAFPDLVLEMCASGGGRLDGAVLAHAHTYWISDQPRALEKLAIHFGSGRAHPAVCCNDWLVDWPAGCVPAADGGAAPDPRGDLAFRLRVAMLGSFGISAPVQRWSEANLAAAAAHVALYRDHVRALVQSSDRYELTAPPPADGNGDWAVLWYAAKDGRSGVLFAFRLAGARAVRRFRLPGLAAGMALAGPDAASAVLRGAMVTLRIRQAFTSALVLVGPVGAAGVSGAGLG
ncbi:MAG: hypothetical protein BGP12_19235 [Rhodospirillales bacterium 70-18]|nr:MAG: hypothetical protein BGP12_19235 [Rhodospirillales bacterium 70-18]